MTKKAVPRVSKAEVDAKIRKSETIQLRLTPTEKDEIKRKATSLGLSVTEYLIKCHAAVASKLPQD